jgi:hypothetical protein
MGAKKTEDCNTLITICLTAQNNTNVEIYQEFVKSREKKVTFTKVQTINRIIKEWAEDRHLTLEVTRK